MKHLITIILGALVAMTVFFAAPAVATEDAPVEETTTEQVEAPETEPQGESESPVVTERSNKPKAEKPKVEKVEEPKEENAKKEESKKDEPSKQDPPEVTNDGPNPEQVCRQSGDGWQSKVDTSGDPSSVTVTAPDGKLIAAYCVSGGQVRSKVVEVEPTKTVTITTGDKYDVSHYQVKLVDEPEPEPEVTTGEKVTWEKRTNAPDCETRTVTTEQRKVTTPWTKTGDGPKVFGEPTYGEWTVKSVREATEQECPLPPEICEADFEQGEGTADDMWEITWGRNFGSTEAPAFTHESFGGLTTINGAPTTWTDPHLYVTRAQVENGRTVTYGFADGTTITAVVSGDADGCPNVTWTVTPPEEEPEQPTDPETPVEPETPVTPEQPTTPEQPVTPNQSTNPAPTPTTVDTVTKAAAPAPVTSALPNTGAGPLFTRVICALLLLVSGAFLVRQRRSN